MAKKPFFSIITTVYNSASKGVKLNETIQSTLSQRGSSFEYIVVDDCSTDDSLALVNKYKKKIGKIVRNKKNLGIYGAMNAGIINSRGEVVFLLNAGDYFLDDRVLADVEAAFKKNPEVKIVYGNILSKDEGVALKVTVPLDLKHLKLGLQTPHQATFARREALTENGLFDTQYRAAGDLDWFIKCAIKGYKSLYIDRNITYYEFLPSSNYRSKSRREGAKIIGKHFGRFQSVLSIIRSEGSSNLRNFARRLGVLNLYYKTRPNKVK